MSEPPGKPSKYAIVDGREVTLAERIPHASASASVIVCTDQSGSRFYATEEEWLRGSEEFTHRAAERGIVTSESSAKDKLALFKKLFKGRSDVHAHGYRRKDGGIGYAPVCANEWKAGICPKKANPRSKCANCPERSFTPLNDGVLVRHFNGERNDFKDVVGLYVLDENGKTSVLVADFDKAGWQDEIAAYRRAGKERGIDVATERSRSGNGGHAWAFFAEPVDAALARNLGSALITAAMSETGALDFKTYDRLFPAQTTVPEGGFGNLISLPFQGQAQRQGNSVFVDEGFKAYPDQWRYLSGIEKITEDQVRLLLEQEQEGPLGPLAFADRADASAKKPWAASRKKPLAREDFPSVVSITKANMIFVDKAGLSPAARTRILRLAAFSNPEFHRAQAMRQSVFGKPRIIALGEETNRYLALPRGCEGALVELFERLGVDCRIDDERRRGAPIDVEFKGSLRELQLKAATALLQHECGILSAPTGFGKTVIGAYCIAQLKMRTLVIVPGTALLSQWQERLASFLAINEELPELLTKTGRKSRKKRSLVGQIGAGKSIPSGIIDIATFQSLMEKGGVDGEQQVKDLVREYDLVLCDECQHGAAPQLERVLRTVNARRVYGLSATPKRADGLEGILFMHCGPIRCEIDPQAQAKEQGFSRHLVPRFTRVRLPKVEPGSSFNQILDALCAHAARNRLIVDDTVEALEHGRTPLVITKRKEHAALLADALNAQGYTTFLLTGEGSAQEKKRRLQAVRDVPESQPFALVATGSYLGEGFDEPRLDTLILAAPAAWEGVITQYSGRLHREREGKSEVIVRDYIDASVPMLDRMYKKRLRSYKKLGYEIVPFDAEDASAGRIIGAGEYPPALSHDLETASKSVFISSPYISRQRIEHAKPALEAAVLRGIDVSAKVGKPSSERYAEQLVEGAAMLRNIGCSVSIEEGSAPALAIIDERIVWYGTIPPLAFPKSDDCSLRLESAEVAFDLMQSMDADRE